MIAVIYVLMGAWMLGAGTYVGEPIAGAACALVCVLLALAAARGG